MSARDEILIALMDAKERREQTSARSGVRPAARLPGADSLAQLSGFSRAISSSYHESLVERFATRLTLVKGEALRVPDTAAAADAIKALLERWQVKGAAYQNDRLVRELNVPALLQAKGLAAQFLDGGDGEQKWKEELAAAAQEGREPSVPWDVAIMGCDGAVAETGSIIHRTAPQHGRGGWLLCRSQLVLLDAEQIVPDLEDLFVPGGALDKNDLPRAITAVTGPSRTADIEQTLTVGVHGPGRFCAIVIG